MIQEDQYFEGNVKSLGYITTEGKSTIGVISIGEYKFGTAEKEVMHIIEGTLEALLPDCNEWKTFEAGSSFEVAANTSFKVKAVAQVAYLCQYR